jgi:hypothetical protein
LFGKTCSICAQDRIAFDRQFGVVPDFGALLAGTLCLRPGPLCASPAKPSLFSSFAAIQQDSTMPESLANANPDLADSSPGWTRRERFRLDGVRYDVYVAACRNGYCGVWVCVDCGEHGASPVNDTTPEEAHARAKISLCVHHKQAHRRRSKPR